MNREKERIEEGKDEEEGMMPKSAVYNEKNRKNINDFLFNDEEQQEYDDENNREGEMNKSISLFNRKMYLEKKKSFFLSEMTAEMTLFTKKGSI